LILRFTRSVPISTKWSESYEFSPIVIGNDPIRRTQEAFYMSLVFISGHLPRIAFRHGEGS
jgi:hypothetical protein